MLLYLYGAAFAALAAFNAIPVREGSPGDMAAAAAVHAFVALALFARQRWIESVILGGAVILIVSWAAGSVAVAWTGWPYSTVLESVISLSLGLILSGFWFLMWRLVRAYYLRHPAAT